MKELKNISENEKDIIASTWALKLSRPENYYKFLFEKYIKGKKDVKELPYFIYIILKDWGYREF